MGALSCAFAPYHHVPHRVWLAYSDVARLAPFHPLAFEPRQSLQGVHPSPVTELRPLPNVTMSLRRWYCQRGFVSLYLLSMCFAASGRPPVRLMVDPGTMGDDKHSSTVPVTSYCRSTRQKNAGIACVLLLAGDRLRRDHQSAPHLARMSKGEGRYPLIG